MDLNFLKPNKKNIAFSIIIYFVIIVVVELFTMKLAVLPPKCPEGFVHGLFLFSSQCITVWLQILVHIVIPLFIIYVIVSMVIRK